jgi:hypothetical protein
MRKNYCRFLKGEIKMKSFLYFIVGLVMLPVVTFEKIRELGDVTVSNYIFERRLQKNLKRKA